MLAVHAADAALSGTSQAAFKSNLGYSGEQWDASLRMQNLRARAYDPGNGRFIGLDPFTGNMQDPQSLHKYAYVHGDPIGNIDPTGEMSTTMAVSLGIGALAIAATLAFRAYANRDSSQSSPIADISVRSIHVTVFTGSLGALNSSGVLVENKFQLSFLNDLEKYGQQAINHYATRAMSDESQFRYEFIRIMDDVDRRDVALSYLYSFAFVSTQAEYDAARTGRDGITFRFKMEGVDSPLAIGTQSEFVGSSGGNFDASFNVRQFKQNRWHQSRGYSKIGSALGMVAAHELVFHTAFDHARTNVSPNTGTDHHHATGFVDAEGPRANQRFSIEGGDDIMGFLR